MDDTKTAETPDPRTITVKLGGEDYRFAPLTAGQMTSVMLAQKGARGLMSLTTLGRVLSKSCGDEVWDGILDRLEDDAITLTELGDLFETLAERSGVE